MKFIIYIFFFFLPLTIFSQRLYKIKPGDSYYKVAKRFKINYLSLAKMNENRPLIPGQQIKIPSWTLYKIQKGDTYLKISQKLKIKIKDLKELNNDHKKLISGKYLKIPSKKSTKNANNIIQTPPIKQKQNDHAAINTNFSNPVIGEITKHFGTNENIMNYGIVYSLKNENIRAAYPGRIILVESLRGLGKTIMIQHNGNYISVYANIQTTLIQAGDFVKQKQLLAKTPKDKTFFFSVFYEGKPIAPSRFLGNKG